MRKLLFLTGLVMAAVLFACGGNANASASSQGDSKRKSKAPRILTETSTDVPSLDDEDAPTIAIVIDGGLRVEVDTFTSYHYDNLVIKKAFDRELFMAKKQRPTNASSFGAKKAQQTWKTFRPNDKIIMGRVSVIHYEKGIEVVHDGHSWFYDGFLYKKSNLKTLAAAESVLYPGRWEPVVVEFDASDLMIKYAYPTNYHGSDNFYIWGYELKEYGISTIDDLIISSKEY